MALAAVREIEQLTVASRVRSDEAAREGVVLSFDLGKLKKHVDGSCNTFDQLRFMIAEARPKLRKYADAACVQSEVDGFAALFVETDRLQAHLRFEFVQGNFDIYAMSKNLDGMKVKGTGNQRFIRRLSKRSREAAEALDGQVARFLVFLDGMRAQLEARGVEVGGEEDFRRERKAFIRKSIPDRYPVINDYLAR